MDLTIVSKLKFASYTWLLLLIRIHIDLCSRNEVKQLQSLAIYLRVIRIFYRLYILFCANMNDLKANVSWTQVQYNNINF